jgi:hypothetical protein
MTSVSQSGMSRFLRWRREEEAMDTLVELVVLEEPTLEVLTKRNWVKLILKVLSHGRAFTVAPSRSLPSAPPWCSAGVPGHSR